MLLRVTRRAAVHRHSARRSVRQSCRAAGARHAVRACLDRAVGGADFGHHGDHLPARPHQPSDSPPIPRRPDHEQALVIIAAVTLFALYLGLRAKRGHDMSLEQWTVGGRSFGTAFVFLLMAGEIYTTFTFLGGSGFAYGKGAPVYYILAYGTLAYILSYWMLPPIWRLCESTTGSSRSRTSSRANTIARRSACWSRWLAWPR